MKTTRITSPRIALILLLLLLCNSGCAFHNRQGTMFHLTADYNSYLRKALIWEEFDLRPMRRHRVEYFRWRHPINRMASVTLYPDEIEVKDGEPCPYVLPAIPKFQPTNPPLPPLEEKKETSNVPSIDDSYNSVPSPPPFPDLEDTKKSEIGTKKEVKKEKINGNKEEPQFVPAPPLPREAKEFNNLNSVARVVSLQKKIPAQPVSARKVKAKKKSATGILFPRVR